MDLSIYVLECENNKYYVGKTTQRVEHRFSQHTNPQTNQCAFTNKYKPLKIIETIKSTDQLDEDKVTKRYMMKYGIENVRGGAYTKLELEDWQIKSLNHEFTSSSDLCFHCGKPGHFANTCPNLIFNVDQFVDKYNDEFSIEQQIARIKELLIKVNATKLAVEQTKDMTIKNYLNNKKQIQLVNKNFQCCIGHNSEKQKFIQFINLINEFYRIHISNHSEINGHLPIEIKMLELVNFNINMQKQLDSLLNEFKTEEIIKEILVKLYEKLIGIKSQI